MSSQCLVSVWVTIERERLGILLRELLNRYDHVPTQEGLESPFGPTPRWDWELSGKLRLSIQDEWGIGRRWSDGDRVRLEMGLDLVGDKG